MDKKQNAVAEILGRYRAEIDRLKGEINKAETGKMSEDPYFDAFSKNSEKIESFAKEHGITLQEAYGALFGKMKYAEAKDDAKKKNAGILALSEKGNSAEGAEDGVLSGGEMWAAKKAGISPAQYLKFKKRGNE